MRPARLTLGIAALAALAGGATPALAGTITAELSRTEGSLGESFLLTLTAEGDSGGKLEVPDVPGLVLRQQGLSRSQIFNNGRRVTELHVTIGIYPQQAGEFTIPSFALELDGKREQTLPLTLKVHPAGKGPPPGGQAQQQQQPSRSGKSAAEAAAADTGGVFIERECQNATPYAGQQVLCMVRVYHRGNLNGGQRLGHSSADVRRFNVEGERRYQRVVNGQRYGVIELREILVPTKPGAIEVPPYALEARVLTWSRRGGAIDKFFDNFGGGAFNFDLGFTDEKEVTVKSEPTAFDVKPLPEAGKPAGFDGLVGRYTLTAFVTKDRVAAGETVTVTIQLEGNGILDGIAPLKPATLDGLGKVYADKPDYAEEVDGDSGIRSRHTFKYALVPGKAGEFELGPVQVSFFDPETQRYETLQSDLGRLIVEPGKAEQSPVLVAPQSQTNAQENVQELGSDLIAAHGGSKLTAKQTITSSDVLILGSLTGTSLLFGLGAFGFSMRPGARSAGADGRQRRSRAMRQFRTGLEEAKRLTTQGQATEALAAGYRSLRVYLGDKLGTHGAALTGREVDAKLAELGAAESLRSRVAEVIARAEASEFGGQTVAAGDVAQLLERLDALVAEVDQA